MEIKCGRRTFNVTSKDLILDNGACYQLITQKYFKNWYEVSPIVAKSTFKKLLKEGKIRKSEKKYKVSLSDEYFDLYEFVESIEYDKYDAEKAQQMVNGFTDFMKNFWNNPDLKAPSMDELIETESDE